MSKVSHQRVSVNTGILLKPMYCTFIKDILQSTLRSKLHVELKTTSTKPGGLTEVLLVGCGAKPQFEEAKVLIGKTVKMTEENWQDLKGKAAASLETKETKVVDLEDSSCTEEISSDEDELLESSKENRKVLPTPTVVCGSSEKNGLCTVILDTAGGPVSSKLSETVFKKDNKNKKKNTNSCLESSSNNSSLISSDNSSTSSTQQTSNNSQDSEDFILIKSKKGNVGQDDTIVLDNDTILISSDNDSEDDILIDKVVSRMTGSLKKKEKKKKNQKKIGLFNTICPIRAPESPVVSKKKRKSTDSLSSFQRKSKINKTSGQSDITSSSRHTTSLPSNSSRQRQTEHTISDEGSTPSTSVKHKYDDNVISSSKETEDRTGLRPVVIDSNNVARKGKEFKFKKLETCIKYFQQRGHKVIAFLPRHMTGAVKNDDERARLWTLEEQKVICFTPSRKLTNGQRFAAYDDRFIVQTATELGGVIVSNDNFRDIMAENEKWKETIEKRLLMFTWVGDMLMFPNDPLGRDGPHLEEFLRFPEKGD